jgi:predicted RNA-binding Zn ribbon-like protein
VAIHSQAPPRVVLALANSRVARRPSGFEAPVCDDLVATPEAAERFLRDLGLEVPTTKALRIANAEQLERLQRLREVVEQIASALGAGAQRVDHALLRALNAESSRCPWAIALDDRLRSGEVPLAPDAAALLASLCARELSAIDRTRLKRCERYACAMLFYDTTRNRSGRWHAEDPCGWRERDDRRTGRAR